MDHNHRLIHLYAFMLLFYTKHFYITVSNLKIQYFLSLRKPSCWVHWWRNEIICPSDPSHRDGRSNVRHVAPNSIYFSLPPCGKHSVLGYTQLYSCVWLFGRLAADTVNMEHSIVWSLLFFKCLWAWMIYQDSVMLEQSMWSRLV